VSFAAAAAALIEGAAWAIEHAPILKAVGEALAAGTPVEALHAAVRGAMIKSNDQALREEFDAADGRKSGSQGRTAYEAWVEVKNRTSEIFHLSWENLEEEDRAAWEAAADAAREG